jgi:hypothetical protein
MQRDDGGANAPERVHDHAHVANDGAHPLTLILQPWMVEHLLVPGAAVVIDAHGPPGSHAELLVERTCDTATVWAWPGAGVRVTTPDGRVLIDRTGAASPEKRDHP